MFVVTAFQSVTLGNVFEALQWKQQEIARNRCVSLFLESFECKPEH